MTPTALAPRNGVMIAKSDSAPFSTMVLLLLFVLALAWDAWALSACSQGDAVCIWSAPLVAQPGEKLKIMAVAADGELSEVLVTDPAERRSKLPVIKGGGPP